MYLQTAIDRFRLNPLRDSKVPYKWSDSELVGYFNEIIDQLCEETGVLVDSETPEICQIIVGIVAGNMARGTNAATIQVDTAFVFANDDTVYTFPVTDNIAMTACATQAVSTYCRYLISTDSEFAVTVQKGDDSATEAGAYLPLMTAGLTPIGMLLIQTNASNTFTSGTTSLNGTGITATFESSAKTFTLDSRVIRINTAELAGYPSSPELDIKDKYWMNRNVRTWITYDPAAVKALVHGNNKREYTIWPDAKYPDQVLLTVSRRPLVPLQEAVTTGALTTTLDITPNTKTIHRDSGSFITDGFTAGSQFALSGATNPDNDGTYTIFTVSASSIVTVEAIGGTVQSNGPGTLTVVDMEIEIPEQYVKRLYNGVAHLAFLKRDQQTWDPAKASEHEQKWIADIEAVKRDMIRLNQTPEVNEIPAGLMP